MTNVGRPKKPGVMITRFCKNCGKSFEIDERTLQYGHRRGTFCSIQCVARYHSKTHQVSRICKVCGKPFNTAKSSKNAYCSLECRKERIHPKKPLVPRVCAGCGITFTPHDNSKLKKKNVYHSRECFFKVHTKYFQLPEPHICKTCGKEFPYPATPMNRIFHSKGKGGDYCSQECYWDRNGSMCRRILQQHHTMMQNDPEHLTTEFMVAMTGCRCKRNVKEIAK